MLVQIAPPAEEPVTQRISGVYLIRCTQNGKVYVGSSVNIGKRWAAHRRELAGGAHHSPRLQNAWNKYGDGAFVFSVLRECEAQDLIAQEQSFIDDYESYKPERGFNICRVAGSQLGRKQSDATRKKLSAIALARKPASSETRQKISEAHKGNQYRLGKKLSAESRAKVAAASKRNYASNFGLQSYRHTDEMRRLVSERFKGKPLPAEHREKIALSLAGKPKSEAHRTKVGDAQRRFDAETVNSIRSLVHSGVSQAEAARRFGCSNQTVCNVIHGKRGYSC